MYDDGMAKSLTTPEERVALFQQLFSDTIPHNSALGIKVLAVARGLASMRLDWREELVGKPQTGGLAGGPITAMLANRCGMAAPPPLKDPQPLPPPHLSLHHPPPP